LPIQKTTFTHTLSGLSQQNIHRKYALQLYGSFHLAAVQNLQGELRLKHTGHIYQTVHKGKEWYVLTFGNFVSAHEASRTQNNLPSELKNLHPWVRNVKPLQIV